MVERVSPSMTSIAHPRRWYQPAVAVGVAVLVGATGLLSAGPAMTTGTDPSAPVAVAVPAPKALPAQLDNAQQYQGQSVCNPPPKPGIAALKKLLKKTYGSHPIYTSRACESDPSSEHTEGRALDWMVSLRVPDQRAKAVAFLDWLLAPGADGSQAAMARRMGIMYIGWNNQIWRAYQPMGWGELKGCYAKKSTSYDTYCHRDHIHFSMTWDGAAGLSSYWDGSAQTTPACAVNRTAGAIAKVRKPLTRVAVTKRTKFLDTKTGKGVGKRSCRLQEPRWSSDTQRRDVRIGGRKSVPSVGVRRATVTVTALEPNAPMPIYVWPTGKRQPKKPRFVTEINKSSSATFRVKLGAKGRISVATGTGDTHLRVNVVSYDRGTAR